MSTESINELLSAMSEGGPDPDNPWRNAVSCAFDKMDIGESMIAKARRRYPKHDAAIWNAFRLLTPNSLLYKAPEPVYRAHCAELLDRVRKNQDTTLGTKAEIMMVLSKTSLAHPLQHTASVLYAQLFQEILPHTTAAVEIADLGTKGYKNETERLLADLAQKCRAPDRKPKKESEWRTPPVL